MSNEEMGMMNDEAIQELKRTSRLIFDHIDRDVLVRSKEYVTDPRWKKIMARLVRDISDFHAALTEIEKINGR